MEKPNLPKPIPILEGKFITVPSKTWNAMCETVNRIIDTLNAQTDVITTLYQDVESVNLNVSKLAKITEEIYETLE